MGTSTKANTPSKRTNGPGTETAGDPAADARQILKVLYSGQPPLPDRGALLAALGYQNSNFWKAASILHKKLALMFNAKEWNDNNFKSTHHVADHLVAQPDLALQHLLAFGSKTNLTILHVVLHSETYIEFKLTAGLKLFIRFLLELAPTLPTLVDKKGRTALFQALSEEDEEDEDVSKRQIVQFFCASAVEHGLESQEAMESLIVVAKDPKLHGVHLAIKSNITVSEAAIEWINPRRDDSKAAWLDQKDEDGRTCLHLALTAPFTAEKLWWAGKITDFRPQLLGVTFKEADTPRSLTPLHHFSEQIEREVKRRKEALSTQQTSTATGLTPDSPEIKNMMGKLKLQCLRAFEDEETCKQHMYTGGNGREIFLTLEDDVLTAKSLDAKRKHYNLDTMLKRVHVTDTVKIDWDSASADAKDTVTKWGCAGNSDLYMVFHWLKTKAKVQKVLQVIVDDLEDGKAHSDKAIVECLRTLKVEIWAWKRYDIPTEVMVDSCGKHLKTLYLWCSGRKAVLKSWSDTHGLAKLESLENVYVKLEQGLESVTDMATAAEAFVTDLRRTYREQNKGRELLQVHCEVIPYKTPTNTDSNSAHSLGKGADERGNKEHGWLKCMDEFAHFMEYLDTESRVRQISVALIDDGVKSTYAGLDHNIVTGKSWAKRPKLYAQGTLKQRLDQDLSCVRNYESSHTGHGTVMAYYIRRVCPNVKLYIAKLDPETRPRDGTGSSDQALSFSIESAAAAISWAVTKKVDIISMSWAIDHDSNAPREKPLRDAITEAANSNILLFCGNPDKGEGHNENNTYPLWIDSSRITCIGAATHDGKAWEKIDSKDQSCQFLLPGVQLGIPVESSPFGKPSSKSQEKPPDDWQQCNGSSLSCALAAGLAAMILRCALVTDIEPTDSEPTSKWGWLKTAPGMRSAFKSINEDNTEAKWLAVSRLFGSIAPSEALNATETGKMDMLRTRVVDKFFKEWKAPRQAQPGT